MRFAVAIWVSLLIPLPGVLAAEFQIELDPGIDQEREQAPEDYWIRQWLRRVPPDGEALVLTSRGPLDWDRNSLNPLTPGEMARQNRPQVEELIAAMGDAGLASGTEMLIQAGQVVALLRIVEVDETPPVGRYSRVWQLWEILADAPQADTLSVAYSAVQTLAALGFDVRLARYPNAGRHLYAVLVPEASVVARPPWSHPVGRDALLPVARSVSPATRLGADEVETWTWAEIADQGVPAPREEELSVSQVVPPQVLSSQKLATLELCLQARALGLDCSDRRRRDLDYWIAAVVMGLLVTGAVSWREATKRRERVRQRRKLQVEKEL